MDPIFPSLTLSFDVDNYNNNYTNYNNTDNSIINSPPQSTLYYRLPNLFYNQENNNSNNNNTNSNGSNTNNNVNHTNNNIANTRLNLDLINSTQSVLQSTSSNLNQTTNSNNINSNSNKRKSTDTTGNTRKKLACAVCRIAKSSCTGQRRPCDRCIRLKKTDLCVDPQPATSVKKSNKRATSKSNQLSNISNTNNNKTTLTTTSNSIASYDSDLSMPFNYDLDIEEHRRRLSSLYLNIQKRVVSKAILRQNAESVNVNGYLSKLYSVFHIEDFISFLEFLGYKPPQSFSLQSDIIRESLTPASSARKILVDFSKFTPPEHLHTLPTSFALDYSISPIHAIPDDAFALPFFIMGSSNLLLKFGISGSNCCSLQNRCDCNCTKKTQKLKEIQQKQEEYTKKYANSTNNIFTGVMLVQVNESFERLFGYKQEEIREMFMKQGSFSINSLFRSDYINELHRIDPKNASRGLVETSCYMIGVNKWNNEIPILLLRKMLVENGSIQGAIWYFIPASQPNFHRDTTNK